MSTPDFAPLVARHRAYFRTGATRSTGWREGELTALKAMMADRAYTNARGVLYHGTRIHPDLRYAPYMSHAG
jgi:hypothetical protein